MIIDERMVTYINSLDTGHTPFLENLERTAKQDRVPVIRREMQSFLKVFLKMKTAKENPGGRNCRRILCCFHGTVRRTGRRDYHNRKLRKNASRSHGRTSKNPASPTASR